MADTTPVIPAASSVAAAPASAPASPATPVAQPTTAKPGSAREKVFSAIRQKAGVEPAPAPAATPAAPAPADPKAAPAAKEGDDAPPADLPAEKKTSPWKMVKEKEARIKELDARVAELDKLKITPERQKQIDAIEAKAKALEEEIRFVDYTKSEEYETSYNKPYKAAWEKAITELDDLRVVGQDGQERKLTVQDILSVVNTDTRAQAKAAAAGLVGDEYASDVVEYARTIKELAEKSNDAVEEARTKGAERDQLRQQERQRQHETVTTEIKTQWEKANQEVLGHEKYGTYFKPVDGDQEGNQRLAKGFELADRAFSENPLAPGLTAEKRTDIVKRHAAVRNRCAAFGRLVYQNGQAQARIKELETQLGTYKQAEPGRQGSAAPAAAAEAPRGMKSIGAMLAKYAK